jgi:hypothetical protein
VGDRVRSVRGLSQFAQEKCYPNPSCISGGGFGEGRGGGGGGGPGIGFAEIVALVGGLLPGLAYGASLALLIALAAGGGRRLWDRIKKPSVFAAAEDVDVVECSVYGPRVARPGEGIMIAVFLHLGDERHRASFLAKAMDLSATLRARCSQIDKSHATF